MRRAALALLSAAATAEHAIPRVFMQTHDHATPADVPPELKAIMSTIREDNPDWTHHYYNAADMRKFIDRHLPGRVARAYHVLNFEYGAARADLFKLCFLFVRGGVYMDVKSGFQPRSRGSLDAMRAGINGTIVLLAKRKKPFWFFNWALAAAPRHPAIFAAISRAVHFIELDALRQLDGLSGAKNAGVDGPARGGRVKLITGPHPYTLGVKDFYENAPPALLREWPPCFVKLRTLNLTYHMRLGRFAAQTNRRHPDWRGDKHYTKLKSTIVESLGTPTTPPREPLSPFHNPNTPFDFHLRPWPMGLGLT